jgi:IMP dehydrogenase
MKLREIKKCLSYDDVLLVPKRKSTNKSRMLDTNLSTKVGPLELGIPIISSPMDTVTEARMAIEIGRLGGMGILHRFTKNFEEQANMIREILLPPNLMKSGNPVYIVPAIGVTKEEMELLGI